MGPKKPFLICGGCREIASHHFPTEEEATEREAEQGGKKGINRLLLA